MLKISQTLHRANQVKVNRKILPLQKVLRPHLSRNKSRVNQEKNLLKLIAPKLPLPVRIKRIRQRLKIKVPARTPMIHLNRDSRRNSNRRETHLIQAKKIIIHCPVLNKNLKKVKVVKMIRKRQLVLKETLAKIQSPVQERMTLK